LNKELDAFSFAVSHDLRAPLRHIDGFIRILAEDYAEKLDETGKDYIRRVQAGAERMKHLIDALLGLSRFTRNELNRSKVYLSALGKTVADDLTKLQPERRVEFVIADNMMALGDQNMLRAAIDNLLGNAWKFTEKRPVAKIEFGVTQIDGKDVFFVKDNGAGFNMKFSEKLYTPFQRLHQESEFSGLGIGLSIVQRIVHRHGGRVWAEGDVDKGAIFYFTLP
jgi:light-regulated signal transduction histidine kinase (bacteriophytochrome)